MARQKPGSLVALPRYVEQGDAAAFCCLLHHFGCAGCQVTDSGENGARSDLYHILLPVLFGYAVVVPSGPNQARTRAGHNGWRYGSLEGACYGGLCWRAGIRAAQSGWCGIRVRLRHDAV